RRHTRFSRDWSSDVCSSDLPSPMSPSPSPSPVEVPPLPTSASPSPSSTGPPSLLQAAGKLNRARAELKRRTAWDVFIDEPGTSNEEPSPSLVSGRSDNNF